MDATARAGTSPTRSARDKPAENGPLRYLRALRAAFVPTPVTDLGNGTTKGRCALRSQNTATVTEQDRLRLEEMARSLHTVGDPFRCHLRELEDRLRDAAIVPPARLDPGV